MALGSTQPLTEMSTRSIPGGKAGRFVRLTTYHHPVPLSRNLGTLTSWNPLGHSGPVTRVLPLDVETGFLWMWLIPRKKTPIFVSIFRHETYVLYIEYPLDGLPKFRWLFVCLF